MDVLFNGLSISAKKELQSLCCMMYQHPTKGNASGLNFDVMADRPTDSTHYIHSTTLVIIIIYYLPLYGID